MGKGNIFGRVSQRKGKGGVGKGSEGTCLVGEVSVRGNGGVGKGREGTCLAGEVSVRGKMTRNEEEWAWKRGEKDHMCVGESALGKIWPGLERKRRARGEEREHMWQGKAALRGKMTGHQEKEEWKGTGS